MHIFPNPYFRWHILFIYKCDIIDGVEEGKREKWNSPSEEEDWCEARTVWSQVLIVFRYEVWWNRFCPLKSPSPPNIWTCRPKSILGLKHCTRLVRYLQILEGFLGLRSGWDFLLLSEITEAVLRNTVYHLRNKPYVWIFIFIFARGRMIRVIADITWKSFWFSAVQIASEKTYLFCNRLDSIHGCKLFNLPFPCECNSGPN